MQNDKLGRSLCCIRVHFLPLFSEGISFCVLVEKLEGSIYISPLMHFTSLDRSHGLSLLFIYACLVLHFNNVQLSLEIHYLCWRLLLSLASVEIAFCRVTGVHTCLLGSLVLQENVVYAPLTHGVIHLPCWWSDKGAALSIQLPCGSDGMCRKSACWGASLAGANVFLLLATFMALSGGWLIYAHNVSKLSHSK